MLTSAFCQHIFVCKMGRKAADPQNAAFEETGAPSPPRPRSLRIKHRDGRILWGEMKDADLLEFSELVKADPQSRALLSEEPEKTAEVITPKHIGQFLDLLAFMERLIVPPMVEKKTKLKMHPSVVQRCFVFSDKVKSDLGPCGAEAANNVLPEAVKRAISKVGPGAEFIGGLAVAVHAQFTMALTLTMQMEFKRRQAAGAQSAPPAGANGEAKEAPPMAPMPVVSPNERHGYEEEPIA